MAKKKTDLSKIFLWVLMGMLFIGLAGFGATNLSGTINSVGSVGDKEIRLERYAQTIQQEMRAFEAQTGQPLTFQQAQAFGIPDRALAQLVTARALDHEASLMGLSIGDENLATQIRDISAFQGADGSFDRETYAYALENIGLSESEFESDLRDEAARTLLQGAVLGGAAMPATYENTLLKYVLETRDITWAALEDNALSTGTPAPTEDDLTAFYDANIANYTAPEARDITYAWITPDMILDTVQVEDALLRESYAEREAEFNVPERRLVERLIYGSDAAAAEAAQRVADGSATFEQEVNARGLELSDVDMGDVTTGDLGDAADAVFSADVGTVVGPAPTSLGPALFRVNAVLPAQETSFEEARAALRDDLALDRARRVVEQMIEDSEDLLAGGATLEELAETTEFELGEISYSAASLESISGYPAFRQVADSVTTDDFPTINQLEDGGLFALRLNGTTPATPIPFDDIRDQIATDWERDALVKALTAQAETAAENISAGQDFGDVGILETETVLGTNRNRPVEGLPAAAIEALFTAEPGTALAFSTDTGAVVVRLDVINAVDPEGADAQALAQSLQAQAAGALAQDIFGALAADIQLRAGVQIDQNARNALHTNLQ